MRIDFREIQEVRLPGMNHGHSTSDDINYILSGTGKAICDGKEEMLYPATCHICKKGSVHSLINTGEEDLIMLTVVVER